MTTPEQFRVWLDAPEGSHLEFKSATGEFHFEKLVDYCVAIATKAAAGSSSGSRTVAVRAGARAGIRPAFKVRASGAYRSMSQAMSTYNLINHADSMIYMRHVCAGPHSRADL